MEKPKKKAADKAGEDDAKPPQKDLKRRSPAKSGGGSGSPGTSGITTVLTKGAALLLAGMGEVLKLGREMLVIPAQIWMLIAEVIGGVVLRVWRRALWPLALAIWGLLRVGFTFAERHFTPARAVALVAIAGAVALGVSQWADYRSISVGSDAYSGGVEAIAPAPDITVDRAGDAHSWVMVPLAVAALLLVLVSLAGRAKLARGLIAVGAAAIVISIVVDAPKGLDEGTAAVAYQGAEARLLEGFWVQIAAGAVLIACGVLLPLYLKSAPARERTRRAAGDSGRDAKPRLPKLTPRRDPKGSQA